MTALTQLVDRVSQYLGWPAWALWIIAVLSLMIGALSLVQNMAPGRSSAAGQKQAQKKTTEFRWFQLQYLGVYLTIMLADWLQGTNMYTLYTSYGVNVSSLFLTGFLSSAVFGTFLGIYVDLYGRRLGCVVFCLLEIVINVLEHVPNMNLLLLGRVLGGMSTSLLFTSFESWMVSEHRKRGFDESWLASTFSISSWGNGFGAILAGLLAQLAADVGGDIGPFQLAIALTVICLVPICFWRENYGQGHSAGGDGVICGDCGEEYEVCGLDGVCQKVSTAPEQQSMMASLRSALKLIYEQPSVLCLGLSQACFEGAVYTFVFMWVPSLLAVTGEVGSSLPTGLVFSAFMLAMTLGGMLFGLLLPVFPGGAEGLCVLVYLTAAAAMAVPLFYFNFWCVVVAFLVLEAMVGMFNSCGATLRSQYYPEGLQSSIMSVFRLPLNLLVVAGTKLADRASSVPSMQFVFAVVVGMHLVAVLLQCALLLWAPARQSAGGEKKEKQT